MCCLLILLFTAIASGHFLVIDAYGWYRVDSQRPNAFSDKLILSHIGRRVGGKNGETLNWAGGSEERGGSAGM